MSGSTLPLVPKATIEFEGVKYTAVADHMMIVRYEQLADRSFAYMLLHIERINLTGEMPKFSEFGFLLQAMLREHHPDIGLDVTMRMVTVTDVIETISYLLGSALPSEKKDRDRPLARAAKGPRPRKKSGTGKP